jgi:hypothetical protein
MGQELTLSPTGFDELSDSHDLLGDGHPVISERMDSLIGE